jgi:hypothetical protein
MNAMNINKYSRGDDRESNYRLLNEPVQLKVRMEHVPSTEECAWEDDGGPTVSLVTEMTVEQAIKAQMRVRGARKQRAAKAYRPTESIKIVNQAAPAIKEVVSVRLAGGSAQDEKVAELEARIKELMAVVRAPIVAAERKTESIKKFEEMFNGLRTRV